MLSIERVTLMNIYWSTSRVSPVLPTAVPAFAGTRAHLWSVVQVVGQELAPLHQVDTQLSCLLLVSHQDHLVGHHPGGGQAVPTHTLPDAHVCIRVGRGEQPSVGSVTGSLVIIYRYP